MKSLESAEVLSEVRGRLRNLREDDRALWGKMSVGQMVRHLSCSCEVALGERTVRPVKRLPPVVMKWLALRSGLRWTRNLQTTPELKREISEHTDAVLSDLVGQAIERMERLASGEPCAPSHPMFGPMTEADWMRWGYLHADHHLRQFGR
jgi:hypothetical protein